MRHWRVIAAVLALAGLGGGASPALADDGLGGGPAAERALGPAPVIDLPAEGAGVSQGNPEGVAFDRRTGMVFVSRTATGAIQAGILAGPATTLETFVPESAPRGDQLAQAAGLKVRDGRLYVAGGASGLITVYDIATRAKVASFDTGPADPAAQPFVNDLVVNEDGDIYATDSFRPFIYRIDGRAVAAGRDEVQAISVLGRIPYIAGAYNLNGIVEEDDDELIVVNSATGELFRVIPGEDAPDAAQITKIAVRGGSLTGGDGLLIDRGRLLVVQGGVEELTNGVDAADGAVTVVKLREGRRRASIERRITDPTFEGPSTIARARDVYLVVNMKFPKPSPYTISLLPRSLGNDDD
jgi:sugar lactone lactonase YvrE